jgi:phosphomethylpyrimidine synthase
MDLSTGGDLDGIRSRLLASCPVPFGTVPVYQVVEGRPVEDINPAVIMGVIEKQASQGVDFFTVHAGVLREHLSLLNKRVAGIVSRGGALLARWMLHHNKQNPFYEMFDDIASVMAEYDICFSLGDGLRPGAVADATDEAQLAELRTLGQLVHRARERGCQVMVEGPGHVPFDQIQRNMELQQVACDGAPFYVLGPVVTDAAVGYDHITSAIGGTAAAYYGASFLCYVTPTEHLGLPGSEDVRLGVVASRIAAHAADVARGLKSAVDVDRSVSRARSELNWDSQIASCIDPQTARLMYERMGSRQAGQESKDYCSMCGKDWCSIRINRQIREALRRSGG